MRFASTTSNGPLARRERCPRAPRIRRAIRLRRAFALVASIGDRIGVDAERRRGTEPHRGDRQDPRAAADVEDRAALDRRRRSARLSSAARHSRVVGWRPVPKAMPGSSASTTSSGAAAWRRHVGRMTSRRPTRSTGKCRFHASPSRPRRSGASSARRSAAGRTPADGPGPVSLPRRSVRPPAGSLASHVRADDRRPCRIDAGAQPLVDELEPGFHARAAGRNPTEDLADRLDRLGVGLDRELEPEGSHDGFDDAFDDGPSTAPSSAPSTLSMNPAAAGDGFARLLGVCLEQLALPSSTAGSERRRRP